MGVSEIAALISSVGFPIACCIYLIHTNDKTVENLRKTVENNTKVMIKLCERMGVDYDKEE